MPTVLVDVKDVVIPQGEFYFINYNHDDFYYGLLVTVTAHSEVDDYDIYVNTAVPPSLTAYHYKQASNINPENLLIWELNPAHYRIGIYGYTAIDKCDIKVELFYPAERNLMEQYKQFSVGYVNIIDDTVRDIEDDTDDIETDIQVDLTQITTDINAGFDDLSDDIHYDISDLSNTVRQSNRDLSDSISNELRVVSGDIAQSLASSGNLVYSGLSDISHTVNRELTDLGLDVKNAIDRNTEAIRDNTPEPLVLALRVVSDNIKAVSHNTIDDILLSIFRKVT
jgi:hypothetical protein